MEVQMMVCSNLDLVSTTVTLIKMRFRCQLRFKLTYSEVYAH